LDKTKMKKLIAFFLYTVLLAGILVSCKATEDEENPVDPGNGNGELQTTFISGKVVDNASGNPLDQATIKVVGGETTKGTTSDSEGEYYLDYDIAEDMDLLVIGSKEGYFPDTTVVFAIGGDSVDAPLLSLERDTTSQGAGVSGGVASVYLYEQSAKHIGIKESGAKESAAITFVAVDSLGIPISSDNSEIVEFRFGGAPNGGEYLYPSSVETNAYGRATVTLNSGTIAGNAQIVAEINTDNGVIRSKPVLVAIYGGMPDSNHFHVAAAKLNYPELGVVGFEIPFTAYVGDKYSNPVRPNTSIYFNCTSGIIDGSNLTDELGRATVTLLTQPWPDHDVYGPGFFEVTANTENENYEKISTSTVRLLSGAPVISVTPGMIDIPNGGIQSFDYTVSDVNGNPLAEGAQVKVEVKKGDIELGGSIEVKFPDTQSKAFTQYSFSAFDSKADTVNAQSAQIDIIVTGPNGEETRSISGTTR
jgi:hypothetical protein